MSVRDNEDNQNLVKSVDLSQPMKSRERSYQPKCHTIHWILPLFAYGYVPLLFILGPLMDDDGKYFVELDLQEGFLVLSALENIKQPTFIDVCYELASDSS